MILKRIYFEPIQSNSVIAAKKGRIAILAEVTDKPIKEYFYTSFTESGGSLKMQDFMSLTSQVALDSLTILKANSTYVGPLAVNINYYDKPSEDIKKIIESKGKNILFSKNGKTGIFFLSTETDGITKCINYFENVSKIIVSHTLPANITPSNFFLHDIIGDTTPEVFIITPVYFMGNNLVELSIFTMSYSQKPA